VSDGEESREQRVHRELMELLQELRVALPGVQVLFAFLLTVPFAAGFDRLDASDRRVYFAAVLLSALATILLIAPTAHHRATFRTGVDVKERVLMIANAMTLAGTVVLALAMGAVVYVVTNVLYRSTLSAAVAVGLVAVTAALWFVVPFVLGRGADRGA
jgi:hypothetical protein